MDHPTHEDPRWVRALTYYVLAVMVFGFIVPSLPKSVQEFTWVHRPFGRVMMLLTAFAMPIVLPYGRTTARWICTKCGRTTAAMLCSDCGGDAAWIPPEPPPRLRRRVLGGVFFACLMTAIYVLANYGRTT